jgi:DNA-binding transcriptional MerR regulator
MSTETLTVQQVSAALGVSEHTLRYYERAGLVPSVGRAGNGHRRYSDLDRLWVVFVTRLRATGMPVAKIRRYTQLALEGESTVAERLALLAEHRDAVLAQIAALTENLRVIEAKIAHYEDVSRHGTTTFADCVCPEPTRWKFRTTGDAERHM